MGLVCGGENKVEVGWSELEWLSFFSPLNAFDGFFIWTYFQIWETSVANEMYQCKNLCEK